VTIFWIFLIPAQAGALLRDPVDALCDAEVLAAHLPDRIASDHQSSWLYVFRSG
jgi:hypothetical protein